MVMCMINVGKVTTTKKNVIWEYLNILCVVQTHIFTDTVYHR